MIWVRKAMFSTPPSDLDFNCYSTCILHYILNAQDVRTAAFRTDRDVSPTPLFVRDSEQKQDNSKDFNTTAPAIMLQLSYIFRLKLFKGITEAS